MQEQIKQLQQQVAELQKQIDTLNQSSTITFQVDNAFKNRGFLKKIEYQALDPLDYDTLNTLIDTPSGDVPVLAFPIRWLKLTDTYGSGGNYYVPAYTLITDIP
jgi:hypothetical protein